ncbi:MAG: nuclear transport factor 2 family protein [Acidobacteriota bacterium]
MLNTQRLLAVGILSTFVTTAPVAAQTPLTAQDRTDIQDLVAHYARALAGCAAEEWADLYAPGGYFFSSIRGEVKTRESLILLVQSERHCNPATPANGAGANPAAGATAPARGANAPANASGNPPAGGAPAGGPRPVNAPTAVVEATPDGAKGTASLGNAGGYEDQFVKTPKGWRFKARSVITPQETAARLTAQDFSDLRQLAGNDHGQFDDVWSETPNGKRLRSSGVTFRAVPEGVKGTSVLRRDGGRYDDLYVKTANGWRFASRTYLPPGTDAK